MQPWGRKERSINCCIGCVCACSILPTTSPISNLRRLGASSFMKASSSCRAYHTFSWKCGACRSSRFRCLAELVLVRAFFFYPAAFHFCFRPRADCSSCPVTDEHASCTREMRTSAAALSFWCEPASDGGLISCLQVHGVQKHSALAAMVLSFYCPTHFSFFLYISRHSTLLLRLFSCFLLCLAVRRNKQRKDIIIDRAATDMVCRHVICFQIAAYFILEDFIFYWGHRLLHTKWLYQHIHCVHHE